jgi:hypothetical protein
MDWIIGAATLLGQATWGFITTIGYAWALIGAAAVVLFGANLYLAQPKDDPSEAGMSSRVLGFWMAVPVVALGVVVIWLLFRSTTT